MVLTTIFVIRHGYRSNWNTNNVTGETTSYVPSPTNIPSDPALTAYGASQAAAVSELADKLSPQPSLIITSPFYRCVQTIYPLWKKLRNVPLVCDRGLGEWYGKANFEHPRPADIELLAKLFPQITQQNSTIPNRFGEGLDELHDRLAFCLAGVVSKFDESTSNPRPESIVICSHAAPIIAIGRALTGAMPEDYTSVDFHTYTCSISRFDRKNHATIELPAHENKNERVPDVGWRGGIGVGGGWTCTINAGTDHLPNGGERDWHFTGDESFLDPDDQQQKPSRL